MDKEEVCVRIVKCLENVWSENILYDFAVKVQDETIKCHRLILAACSEFFKALFRSGMKEVTENMCVLNNVSCEVFRMILNTLYNGEIDLTLENCFDVWQAVHLLQITFMIDLCEDFAIDSITVDTWENIFTNAKRLNIERVIDQLYTFMVENFEQFRFSPQFLHLSFNEVKDLIKRQDLVVSKEDLVLESVIKWVEYTPEMDPVYIESTKKINKDAPENEHQNANKCLDVDKVYSNETLNLVVTDKSSRMDKMTELLKQVRTCLVSPTLLFHINKMELLAHNNESKDIIINSLSHHVHDCRHGQWPSAALHRACSEYTNAGIVACDDSFDVLSACEKTWYSISKSKFLKYSIQLVCFDGELYATGKRFNLPTEPCMFVFKDNGWKVVMEMPSPNLLLVSHGDFIYIINKDDKSIFAIHPKRDNGNLENFTDFPEKVDVKHAMIIENQLLLFSSETCNGVDETAVHKIDIFSKVWTRLDNLDGPAEQLISFRNDKFNYILQANGCMWLLNNFSKDGNIEFKLLLKLWNFESKQYGALTYERCLIYFGQDTGVDPPGEERLRKVPGHFDSVVYWGSDVNCSNFIPVTLLKSCLRYTRYNENE